MTARRYEHQGWCRVRRGGTPGPWHILAYPMGPGAQAFCGSKVTGFVKDHADPGEQPEGRRCAACATAYGNDRPRSWRRR